MTRTWYLTTYLGIFKHIMFCNRVLYILLIFWGGFQNTSLNDEVLMNCIGCGVASSSFGLLVTANSSIFLGTIVSA